MRKALSARQLLIGSSVTAMLWGALAAPAMAQEAAPASGDAAAEEEAVDAIVVTGFRAVLRNAINEKREAVTQVDAITAEDIADFPDSNLAESLQRLPGVSIDRDNGDGRGITVRGLGGDFNRTRLNGLEALATAGSNDSGSTPNRSRSFDYNTFASELFSSLKVQKTPSASTDEGSLGATIDLQTGRPFDYKGRALALSAEGSYGENSKKWNPRLAGLVSTRFLDDSMGILVSGAWSKSDNTIDQYRRQAGQSDYLYRQSDFTGNENPQRGGFAAPTGTSFGAAITNPQVIDLLTGSDAAAYAKLYPGAPYNTPGRFDNSLVRIPALANIEQQDVRSERLGITASYQWQIGDRTRLSIDGVYSRFENESAYNQLQTVGLNRNNTNATLNTASNTLTPVAARALYPGLCTPNAGSDLVPAQDCGTSLFGTNPAFATALNSSNVSTASILGLAAVAAGGVTPSNANIFSSNPNNLDPYDYYNNPNSVGYVPSTNRLAFRGALIGRPSVEVLDANVTNGLADYLKLRGVDWRSAVDYSSYVTKFKQASGQLDHEFSDRLKVSFVGGLSESRNDSVGKLVEFNRMDTPEVFTYDERGGGDMPVYDLGFDATDPTKWEVVKGFSGIRYYKRNVTNTYRQIKGDLAWKVNDQFTLNVGANWRKYKFTTNFFERNNDLLNPTLKELGVTTASVARTIQFGQGLNVPAGTTSAFIVPDLQKFETLYGFTCDCINKYGDWRLTNKRNGGAQNYAVTEEDTGVYFQVDFNMDLFGRPLRGNVGERYVETSVVSVGNSTSGRPLTGVNKYADWLPSLNLSYEPIDNVITRFSISQVMARPLLGNLSPTISALSVPSFTGTTTGGTMTIGNPKLSPFRATNIDASVEWYFAPGGLVSLAFFDKQIGSFPQTVIYEGALSEFLDKDAIDSLKLQLTPQQIQYIDAGGTFAARQFRDAPGGYVRGIEASFQMDFTFLPGFLKNFGVQANYTRIWSQLNYILDPGTTTVAPTYGTAPFLNVSPQAFNATLYYETKKFRARVSAAQRKGFSTTYPIAAGACSPGLTNSPADPSVAGTLCNSPLINDFAYSRSTLNVDASVSWNILPYATLTLEGLNLTNQRTQRYAYQGQEAVTNYASTGRILRAGVRVKFN
ncbi:TonB-dependent receptor domain-containing protein [Novosphingobium sp. TH158]|uniref:TonB-dependent receptor domain-containing protein n=1 Tax=Novosphingobium sp. TH158 TaxID=2067455 RepID=UPI000C7C9EF1|nr:TonB-dependent receptor [Novosphingobium sp. TH158]PLK25730.1 TonB-dependent receptor [Novosphingobium sp. TH158]